MEPAHVSAIISAIAGITGVLLGNGLVAFKERRANHSREIQETTYLGAIVVSHLDRFASGCWEVAMDDGTEQGRPAGVGGEYVTVAKPPEFRPLDINVSWKLLPKDLMYSILRLPDEQDQLNGNLAGINEFNPDPPDHIEFFQARQRGYAVLGLHASDLAEKLRLYAGFPAPVLDPGEWSRDKSMKEVIEDIDAKRTAYQLRQAARSQLLDAADNKNE